MKLNYYCSFYSKKAKKWAPGIKPLELTQERWREITSDDFTSTLIMEYRGGDAEAKRKLPAVCWTGYAWGGTRKIENMSPTGLYIIDIDHISKSGVSVKSAYASIVDIMQQRECFDALRLAHITPSGDGLRLVMQCTQVFNTLGEHMQWLDEEIGFNDYGDFDTAVKDICRLSFIPQASDILFEDGRLWADIENFKPIVNDGKETKSIKKHVNEQQKISNGGNAQGEWKPLRSQYADYKYKGTLLTTIIDKYVEVYGEPEQGETIRWFVIFAIFVIMIPLCFMTFYLALVETPRKSIGTLFLNVSLSVVLIIMVLYPVSSLYSLLKTVSSKKER